jgi:hypothetical protein
MPFTSIYFNYLTQPQSQPQSQPLISLQSSITVDMSKLNLQLTSDRNEISYQMHQNLIRKLETGSMSSNFTKPLLRYRLSHGPSKLRQTYYDMELGNKSNDKGL